MALGVVRSRVTLVLATLLAAVAIVAVACGGSGRLSAEELAEHANVACEEANGAIGALVSVSYADATLAAATVEEIVGVQRALRDELAELRPPSDLQDTYDSWLADLDTALDASEDLAEALRRGDPAEQAAANERAAPASARADEAAATIGADACAAPPSPGDAP